jgi:uncharacterized protein YbaR (Trm112 family)
MAIVLCPVCKGKCLCVACDGRMEIYNEGKQEWLTCPVCSSQNKNVSDNGVCQTCRGVGTIDESAPLRGGVW